MDFLRELVEEILGHCFVIWLLYLFLHGFFKTLMIYYLALIKKVLILTMNGCILVFGQLLWIALYQKWTL